MKRKSNTLTPCLLAALCLALPGGGTVLRAADDLCPATAGACSASDQPMAFHRASRLIGMRVHSQTGQSLGRIKDIVIDGQAERVSYAVLAVNRGFLGLSQKLLAVPLSALKPGDRGTHLVLNADRKSLETAQGFAASHWPSPTAPSWGAEPFWQEGAEMTRPAATHMKGHTTEHDLAGQTETESPDPYPPGSLGYPGY